MKLSIITTITNPIGRQDFFKEALECFNDLGDEVIVVDGSREPVVSDTKKMKVIHRVWDYDWNWLELPERFKIAREECTGDWILKLDIDHLIHEADMEQLREIVETAPLGVEGIGMQKVSFCYGGRHYDKGLVLMIIRNLPYLSFGKNIETETDLCYPIKLVGTETHYDSELGKRFVIDYGKDVKFHRSGISFYNYDYFFKTKEFTENEFWRMSQAYYRHFKSYPFGNTKKKAFDKFLNMQKTRKDRAEYETNLYEHPKYVREMVRNLKPEQFGFNAWGLL